MKHRVLTFAFLLLGTLAFVSCQKDKTEDGVSVRPDHDRPFRCYCQLHHDGSIA